MPTFPDDVVNAVLAHMNSDHNTDNLLIVRAFADANATQATMTGLDENAGFWSYDGKELRIAWSQTISERPEIRREIVLLHSQATEKLTKP